MRLRCCVKSLRAENIVERTHKVDFNRFYRFTSDCCTHLLKKTLSLQKSRRNRSNSFFHILIYIKAYISRNVINSDHISSKCSEVFASILFLEEILAS